MSTSKRAVRVKFLSYLLKKPTPNVKRFHLIVHELLVNFSDNLLFRKPRVTPINIPSVISSNRSYLPETHQSTANITSLIISSIIDSPITEITIATRKDKRHATITLMLNNEGPLASSTLPNHSVAMDAISPKITALNSWVFSAPESPPFVSCSISLISISLQTGRTTA